MSRPVAPTTTSAPTHAPTHAPTRAPTNAPNVGQRLIVVAGPTGTGKSDLGLDLAERLDGEIVNADSMQLYRGMDIGTAKIPVGERRGIRHHLLDVLDVTETATVASYQRDARSCIEDVLARGRIPILVGGSGLYIQSVVDEIAFPATDPEVRARLEGDLDRLGIEFLFGLLTELDPAAAISIGPANGRKIVRALEVIEITGQPFTATLPRPGWPRYGAVLLRLDRSAGQLDQRVSDRVRAMVAAGFLDEVRALDQVGLRRGVTASRALGYAQLLAVLDGDSDLQQAIAATAAITRRFVRRQRSWFRRDHRMVDLDAGAPDLVDRALAAVSGVVPSGVGSGAVAAGITDSGAVGSGARSSPSSRSSPSYGDPVTTDPVTTDR